MADNGRREKVALCLASGLSVRKTARNTLVAERTIYRWLNESSFNDRVAELRTRLFNHAVGRLAHGSKKAASTLNSLLKSADDRVKLSAAKAILETGIKAREALELAQRLDEIKTQLIEKRIIQ